MGVGFEGGLRLYPDRDLVIEFELELLKRFFFFLKLGLW